MKGAADEHVASLKNKFRKATNLMEKILKENPDLEFTKITQKDRETIANSLAQWKTQQAAANVADVVKRVRNQTNNHKKKYNWGADSDSIQAEMEAQV